LHLSLKKHIIAVSKKGRGVKDIDFDELDRAVSSVLGQKSPHDEDTVTTQAVSAEESAEATETSMSSDAPTPRTTSSTPPLAIKRRGKFMDVMHPSADMTSATPAAPVAQPMRTSPQLKPLTNDLTPEASDEEPATDVLAEPTAEVDESHALIGAEPAPVENLLPEHVADETDEVTASEAPVTPTHDETTTTPDAEGDSSTDEKTETSEPETETEPTEPVKSLYVDPLELAAPKEEAVPEEEVIPEVASTTEPTVTPFLTDTKVDKRPLGAFGEAEGAAPADTDTSEQAPVDTQSSPAVPLPRELQPDVVQVESAALETEAAPAAPFATSVKSADTDDGRVEGHPLFDTSTYHEPIAAVHGAGMPGWVKWLIGLLVCLALGAGVGYFLFTAGL
jgi:hypothetical protein